MSTFYPATEAPVQQSVRTSISLTKEELADIKAIAQLWNELDKSFGKKRPRKWSKASVIERFLSVGIDGFWAQVGGRPGTDVARKDFLARAAENIRKSANGKKG